MTVKNVIIDCDPGTDDAIALMLALRSEELNVRAVTVTAGNRNVRTCTENALKILEYCRRCDIPVGCGAEKPLKRELCQDDIYSGRDGMAETFLPYGGTAPAAESGTELLIHTIERYQGDIHIISIAPMTNLALALMEAPELASMISSITTIDGSYGTARMDGICNSRLEWNVTVDPEAAKRVMESGIPVYAMGVDVTGTLKEAMYERLLGGSGKETMPHRFLADAGSFLRKRGLEPQGMFVDAMAVAYLIHPEIAQCIRGKVRVETKGDYTTGMTLFDNVGNYDNASDVYAACRYDMELLERILAERVFL